MSIFRSVMAIMAVMKGGSVGWDGYVTTRPPCTRQPKKQTQAEAEEAIALAEAKRARKSERRKGLIP